MSSVEDLPHESLPKSTVENRSHLASENEKTIVENERSPSKTDGSAHGANSGSPFTERVEDEHEDETKYPSGLNLTALIFGLCIATFVVR